MHNYRADVCLSRSEYLTPFSSFPLFDFTKNLVITCCENTKKNAIIRIIGFINALYGKDTEIKIIKCRLYNPKKDSDIQINYSVGKKSYKTYVNIESIKKN